MKKSPSIITVLLVLPLLQVHSQNLEGNHTYRIGDKVEKQLVEYELNDESAKNVVWNLRDLSDLMITRTDPMIPKENGADGRLWKKK